MGYLKKFKSVLYTDDTPHKIASSFAFGVFWGFSPLLGLHTIMAFFTAWLFGLNRFIAVVGVYVTNPWTIIPAYTFCLWVGMKVTGVRHLFTGIDWDSITFVYLIHEMKHLLWPFIVGTTLVGVISAIISYFIIYHIAVRYQKKRARVGQCRIG